MTIKQRQLKKLRGLDAERKEYIQEICTILGMDDGSLRDRARHAFKDTKNPRYGALMIFEELIGPGRNELVKSFAIRLGFDGSYYE